MPRGESRPNTRGFTLVWLLALLAVMAVGLSVVGPSWAEQARRQREDELLRIGQRYAQAIAQYHRSSPGSQRQFPASLQDLLEDTRFIGLKRHLRRLDADPVEPTRPWGLVRGPDGRIRGVYSTSSEIPLRQAPVDLGTLQLPAARTYADWQFMAKVDG